MKCLITMFRRIIQVWNFKKAEFGNKPLVFLFASILNYFMPKYALYKDASNLLNYITDNTKTQTEEIIEQKARQALANGVLWLKDNHHIKKCDTLLETIDYFPPSKYQNGKLCESLSNQEIETVNKLKEEFTKVNPHCSQAASFGVGNLAREVLSYWDQMWDLDISYDLLALVIQSDNLQRPLPPMFAIETLERMENQFIIETIY